MTLPCSIGTIINFCSNDYPFLRHCIDSIKTFSKQVIIPVCDHYFDGKPEERETLQRIYAENRDVQFIEFPYDWKNSFYASHSSLYWHNLARLIGRFFLKSGIEFALFLDCDEIVDTNRWVQWLEAFPYQEYEALHFRAYWYFRDSRWQAKTWENSPLMVKKEITDGRLLMAEQERPGTYDAVSGQKKKGILGLDELPMFHHYSWVRTKDQLMRKVQSWSHSKDRNWTAQVEEEFSHEFNGTDFVHGYAFIEVPPFIDIDLMKKPKAFSSCDFSHVRRLSHEELIKIDISLTYQIPLETFSEFR